MLQAQFYSGPSGSSATPGIALGPGFSFDRARLFNEQHRRNGQFSTTIMKHGMSRDTSLFAASRMKRKQVKYTKERFESMDELIEDYNNDVNLVLRLQQELIHMQCKMTIVAIEMINARIIQQAVRSWVARHKLKMLKVSRFIYDRIYFRRYYKRRMRAACKMAMRMLMFIARKMLKVHRKQKAAAILIQKLFHKWKLYRNIQFRMVVLGKVASLWKHYALFGKCRAIMHMRRKEVIRVQKVETAQYKALLAAEQQRQAEEAERLRLEEEHRLEMEAKAKPKSRFVAAAKKQKSASGLTAGAADGVKPSSTTTTSKSVTPQGKGSAVTSDTSKDVTLAVQTVSTALTGQLAVPPSTASIDPLAVNNANSTVVDRTLVLKAFSTGLIAGQTSTQVMHTFVENRYGSVYGGFYGEYCCIQDNRVHSFAAVRFRFMLRCLRTKRLKSLNGPMAKNFFYMLSHLHNTTQERVFNPVVQYLQTCQRAHAAKRAARHSQVSISSNSSGGGGGTQSGGAMGKMLMSSFRRTKLSLAVHDASDTDSSDSPILSPALSPNKSSFKNMLSNSASRSESPVNNMKTDYSALETIPQLNVVMEGHLSVQNSQKSLPKAFPTYKIDRIPPGFVTHSYRPRTFAELVLLILDMKKAVLKTPCLIDDSIAPPRIARPTIRNSVSAAVVAMARSKDATKRKENINDGHRMTKVATRVTAVKPAPLVRMDSNRSTGDRAPLVRMDSSKSASGTPALIRMDSTKSNGGAAPLVRMDSTRSKGDAPKLCPTPVSEEIVSVPAVVDHPPTKAPKPPLENKKSFKRAHAAHKDGAVMIPIAAVSAPVVSTRSVQVAAANHSPHGVAPVVTGEKSVEKADHVETQALEPIQSTPAIETVQDKPALDASYEICSTQSTLENIRPSSGGPVPLRAHRVLRPAVVHTPYLAPLAYPSSQSGGGHKTMIGESTEIIDVHKPSQATSAEDETFQEVVVRIADVQSITPSEILAAARLSVRQAEEVSTPVSIRSGASSRESTRTPGLRANSFGGRGLPSMFGTGSFKGVDYISED